MIKKFILRFLEETFGAGRLYIYRNFKVTEDDFDHWVVEGVDRINAKNGVLEHCPNKTVAMLRITEMKSFRFQFKDLRMRPYNGNT